MTDNWRFKNPPGFVHFLSIPHLGNDLSIEWFKGEIQKLKTHIENHFGVSITDEKLKHSIEIYNKTRQLLQQLYDLRKSEAPKIWGHEVTSVLSASMVYPKETFNEKLANYLNELNSKPGIESLPRIMVIGSEIDDPEYIKIIEDQSAIVVTDYNCVGTRYFTSEVKETGDPITALSERYLLKNPCPRGLGQVLGHDQRLQVIKQTLKEYSIDGVILERIKMCDLWSGETFLLDKELKELGVPTLILEREYALSGVGQMKTRLQAFLEMI